MITLSDEQAERVMEICELAKTAIRVSSPEQVDPPPLFLFADELLTKLEANHPKAIKVDFSPEYKRATLWLLQNPLTSIGSN